MPFRNSNFVKLIAANEVDETHWNPQNENRQPTARCLLRHKTRGRADWRFLESDINGQTKTRVLCRTFIIQLHVNPFFQSRAGDTESSVAAALYASALGSGVLAGSGGAGLRSAMRGNSKPHLW